MKKLFLLFAAIGWCLLATAQTSKIYCELIGSSKFMSKKVNVIIDFGQQAPLFSNQKLVDENGDPITFNSMIDAMNYMSRLGWEFEQAYVVTTVSNGQTQNVYHWLLSKYAEEGEDLHLKTKNQYKKEVEALDEAVAE